VARRKKKRVIMGNISSTLKKRRRPVGWGRTMAISNERMREANNGSLLLRIKMILPVARITARAPFIGNKMIRRKRSNWRKRSRKKVFLFTLSESG
jgi:hypothetical protein